jgi:hypothetical protein
MGSVIHTARTCEAVGTARCELRIQHKGQPIRVFYAFDPRRVAILLLGADKTGQDRFYDELVPKVDRIYDEYLREIGRR